MLSREQEIRLELESHRAELRDEFLRSGLEPEAAEKQVNQVFGDMESAVQNTLSIQPYSRTLPHPLTLLFLFSLFCVGFALFWFLLLNGESDQVAVEKALVWSISFSLLALGFCLHKILFEYFGFHRSSTATLSLALSVLMSFALTSVLDLNNFEVTLHLTGLAVLLGMALHLLWEKIFLNIKYASLFIFSAVANLSALTERPVFSFLGSLRCLFIEQSTVPLTGALATCQQLPLWHPLLLLLYSIILGSVVYLAIHLKGYLKNRATSLVKKIVLTLSLSSFGLAPMLLPDMNKYGEMDIIPWKVEIYQAYTEILGRNPEQKDIEFYAKSRAYQDMFRLKEVLYQSEERKFKIDLLYQEILHRHATLEELEYYSSQKLSVEQIRELLQTQILEPQSE